MNKIIIFALLSYMLANCTGGQNNDTTLYNYQEIIEIYAYTQYFSDSPKLYSALWNHHNLIDYDNQQKYYRSLQTIKTKANWKKFIIKTIEFFITKKKETVIKYYQEKGFDIDLELFNDNYLIKSPLKVSTYWKVLYSKTHLPNKHVLIQELYKKNKLILKIYFDENRFKVKKIDFQKNKITYYDANVKLDD